MLQIAGESQWKRTEKRKNAEGGREKLTSDGDYDDQHWLMVMMTECEGVGGMMIGGRDEKNPSERLF